MKVMQDLFDAVSPTPEDYRGALCAYIRDQLTPEMATALQNLNDFLEVLHVSDDHAEPIQLTFGGKTIQILFLKDQNKGSTSINIFERMGAHFVIELRQNFLSVSRVYNQATIEVHRLRQSYSVADKTMQLRTVGRRIYVLEPSMDFSEECPVFLDDWLFILKRSLRTLEQRFEKLSQANPELYESFLKAGPTPDAIDVPASSESAPSWLEETFKLRVSEMEEILPQVKDKPIKIDLSLLEGKEIMEMLEYSKALVKAETLNEAIRLYREYNHLHKKILDAVKDAISQANS